MEGADATNEDAAMTVEWEEAECAVCGSQSNRKLYDVSEFLYNRPGRASIVRCQHCGHCYLSPRPTPSTISQLYSRDYGPHRLETNPSSEPAAAAAVPAASAVPNSVGQADDSSTATRTSQPAPWYLRGGVRSVPGLRSLYYWLSEDHAFIVPQHPHGSKLQNTKQPTALEIGCGTGGYLEMLVAKGWRVEGIEPSETAGRACQHLGHRVHVGTYNSVTPELPQYDLIAMWMVLEHVHDPTDLLRTARRWIAPGGELLLSVPNFSGWQWRLFRSAFYVTNEPTHLHHFNPQSLRRLMRACDWEITNIHYQENLYNEVGSLGIYSKRFALTRRFGQRCLGFVDNPSMWGRLVLAPLAKLLAAGRMTGRISVRARPATPIQTRA